MMTTGPLAGACLLAIVLLWTGALSAHAGLGAVKMLPGGVQQHKVESPLQKGVREVRVLLPKGYSPKSKYRVLYVLPVTTGFTGYGYPLDILADMNAHNKYGLIIVQMDFTIEPWFGDHATDPQVRQATYLKDFVVPYIEQRYSTPKTPEGRLLFGFSKSGWGAVSLIMKYPEFFGYAASWDAPLAARQCAHRIKDVYGTQAQMDAFRPDLLAPAAKAHFNRKARLVITGESFWKGEHMEGLHGLLQEHGILHHYDKSLVFPHRWSQEWMAPTLKALMALTSPAPRGKRR